MTNEGIKKNAKIIRENLKDDGTFPNNADLPMLIYQGALDVSKDDLEATVETLVEDKRSRLILVKQNISPLSDGSILAENHRHPFRLRKVSFLETIY